MVLPLPSDADEELPAVEPPAEGPEDGEDEEALGEGAGGALEEAVAEPGAAGGDDPAFGELVGEVDGDGVHADDDEREGPRFVSLDVDEPVEEREDPEDDGAAVKGPRRGPELLDDGADRDAGDEREDEAKRPGLKQPAEFLAGGLVGAQVLAGHEPEGHGDERGHEVEGLVAALVEDEWGLQREEVQEPLVAIRREVGVHVPVRPEAAEDLSGIGDAEGFVIGGRPGDGRERERGPGGHGDDADGAELDLPAASDEQGEEEVAEADLGEDVVEAEDGLLAGASGQEDTEGDEYERAPEGMQPEFPLVLAFGGAARRRERQRHADHEHERGLDHVPRPAADPRGMRSVVTEQLPETRIRIGLRDLCDPEPRRRHEQHRQPAEGIERDEAVGQGRRAGGGAHGERIGARGRFGKGTR